MNRWEIECSSYLRKCNITQTRSYIAALSMMKFRSKVKPWLVEKLKSRVIQNKHKLLIKRLKKC